MSLSNYPGMSTKFGAGLHGCYKFGTGLVQSLVLGLVQVWYWVLGYKFGTGLQGLVLGYPGVSTRFGAGLHGACA